MPSRIQRLDNLAYIRQKKLNKEQAGDIDMQGQTEEGKMYILYFLKLVILIL